MGNRHRRGRTTAFNSLAALVALTGCVALAGVAPSASATTVAVRAPECNGQAELCDRALGDVAFATTHNSMASSADRFRPPNQRDGIEDQLRDGIRGFQIDVYEGFARGGSVYTDLQGSFGDRTTDLPRPLVRVAEQIHHRLGAPPPGTPSTVYLCHTFCELGAIPFSTVAEQFRTFLDEQPREVLVVVIEDYVTPQRILEVLTAAGLADELLAVAPGQPLPTLGAMIDAGTRLFVTLENGDGGPTLPNAFAELVEETPFTFTTTGSLRGAASCRANRGPASAPVFQFNHWVTPAGPRRSEAVNHRRLQQRVDDCEEVRGRTATLVAVDFAETSDVHEVVHDLNRPGRDARSSLTG